MYENIKLLKFNKNKSILWHKKICICLVYNDLDKDIIPHTLPLVGNEIFLKLDEKRVIETGSLYFKVFYNNKIYWVFSSDFEEIL
jgi:hypothetical protein